MDLNNLLPLVALAFFGFILYQRFAGKTTSVDGRRLVAEGAALIDVRSPAEFAGGHIAGARNIPLGDVGRRAAEIGPKDKPVVVYCASGGRSAAAAGQLRSLGFAQVHDLGGMSRW